MQYDIWYIGMYYSEFLTSVNSLSRNPAGHIHVHSNTVDNSQDA